MVLPAIASFLGSPQGQAVLGLGANLIGSFGKAEQKKMEEERKQKAYRKALNQALGIYEKGESDFLSETEKPLEELEELKKSIGEQSTEEQQSAAGRIKQDLASMGVRGGQAGTLLARRTGDIAKSGMRDILGKTYEEALGRRKKKADYLASKAKSGMSEAFRLQPSIY